MGSVGKRVFSGSLLLSSGNLLATAISAIGSIFIARLLNPEEYGLIGIALIFPLMISSLADLGFSSALVRFSSMKNSEKYLGTGFIFKLFSSFICGLIIFILAGPFSILLARPYIVSMLRILAIYTFSYTLFSALTCISIGLGEYWKYALLITIQNLLRCSISILMILIGLGVYGVIWAFSISYSLSLTIAILFLTKRAKLLGFSLSAFKKMFSYSLPLYVPILLGAPIEQYFNMLVAWFAMNEEVGNLGIAQNLLTPLNMVGEGVSTALFSSFPLLLGEDYKLKDAFRKATFYTSIIIPSISLAIAIFSAHLTLLIYGCAYTLAPTYLCLLALGGLLAPLGSYVIEPYLNSVGETKKTLRIRAFNMAVRLPLATLLMMKYGILGFIVSSLMSSLASVVYAVHMLSSKLSLRVNVKENVKPLIPPTISSVLAYTSMMTTNLFWVQAILGPIIYLTLLGLTFPIFVAKRYTTELRSFTSDLKIAGPLLSRLLKIELKMAEIVQGSG